MNSVTRMQQQQQPYIGIPNSVKEKELRAVAVERKGLHIVRRTNNSGVIQHVARNGTPEGSSTDDVHCGIRCYEPGPLHLNTFPLLPFAREQLKEIEEMDTTVKKDQQFILSALPVFFEENGSSSHIKYITLFNTYKTKHEGAIESNFNLYETMINWKCQLRKCRVRCPLAAFCGAVYTIKARHAIGHYGVARDDFSPVSALPASRRRTSTAASACIVVSRRHGITNLKIN
ncbi:hypothetical protein CBL_07947 [Carabus blaptoides fortunei]